MVYLVDAQLPKKLTNWLREQGYESLHTLDLPDKNDTEDLEIIRVATEMNEAIVVSKDRDFPEYRLLYNVPERLLWITTGNIVNKDLLTLYDQSFGTIHQQFVSGKQFVELTNEAIIIHA